MIALNPDTEQGESNQGALFAILGRSTAYLTAMEGGNAIRLSGTIFALKQTALIWLPLFHILT